MFCKTVTLRAYAASIHNCSGREGRDCREGSERAGGEMAEARVRSRSPKKADPAERSHGARAAMGDIRLRKAESLVI